MKKFEIILEAKNRDLIHVEAETPEDAMRIALERCKNPVDRSIRFEPKWIEDQEECQSSGRFSMKLVGVCCKCGLPLLEGSLDQWHPEWDFLYNEDSQSNRACFLCSQTPLEQLALQANKDESSLD